AVADPGAIAPTPARPADEAGGRPRSAANDHGRSPWAPRRKAAVVAGVAAALISVGWLRRSRQRRLGG
ncbi:MAG: hypothetical protein M3P34_09005, partial [Actinomycetota bacterium]|nr:hypothetical protein [Actinomycetota bacterium]